MQTVESTQSLRKSRMSSFKILLGLKDFKVVFCLLSFRKVSYSFRLYWTETVSWTFYATFLSHHRPNQEQTSHGFELVNEQRAKMDVLKLNSALVSRNIRRLSNFSSSWDFPLWNGIRWLSFWKTKFAFSVDMQSQSLLNCRVNLLSDAKSIDYVFMLLSYFELSIFTARNTPEEMLFSSKRYELFCVRETVSCRVYGLSHKPSV